MNQSITVPASTGSVYDLPVPLSWQMGKKWNKNMISLCYAPPPCFIDNFLPIYYLAVQVIAVFLFAQWLFNDSVSNTGSVYSSRTAWPLKMGPIGCTETSVITNLCCVTSLKSKCLIHTAAQAWNHTHISSYEFGNTVQWLWYRDGRRWSVVVLQGGRTI